MKKVLIIMFIFLIIFLSFVLFDNFMIKTFNTKPIIAYKNEVYNGYVYKTLLANIYYCSDENIYYESKNNKFSCPITDPLQLFDIVDEASECDNTIEKIYEDEDFSYYLNCKKSDDLYLKFKDGRKINLESALFYGDVTIDLLIQKGLAIEKKSRFNFKIIDTNEGLEDVIINMVYTYNAFVEVKGKLPSLKMAIKEKEVDLNYLIADLDYSSKYGQTIKTEDGNDLMYKTLSYTLLRCDDKIIISGTNYPYENNFCKIIN